MEQIIGAISGTGIIFLVLVMFLTYRLCRRKSPRSHANNINNDTRKDIVLNSVTPRDGAEYKRGSKMSNLEVIQRSELANCQQRPASYAAAANDPNNGYTCNNVFVNNLDTLRSYGSAGDELENVPPEYRKPIRSNQHVNLNGHTAGDGDAKQAWSEQMHTFTDGKINNGMDTERFHIQHKNIMFYANTSPSHPHIDLKRASPISSTGSEHRCATIKSSGILPGRLLNVPLPNPNAMQFLTVTPPPPSGFVDESSGSVHSSAYHWDCSDWVRRSHNPLPNITEVPGSEVPDSSSFHSNESNESQQQKMGHIPPSMFLTQLFITSIIGYSIRLIF